MKNHWSLMVPPQQLFYFFKVQVKFYFSKNGVHRSKQSYHQSPVKILGNTYKQLLSISEVNEYTVSHMARSFSIKYLKSLFRKREKSKFHMSVCWSNYYQEKSVFLPEGLDLRKY